MLKKSEEGLNLADVVLIDWTLGKIASHGHSKPMIVMDRSPPADQAYWLNFNGEFGTILGQARYVEPQSISTSRIRD